MDAESRYQSLPQLNKEIKHDNNGKGCEMTTLKDILEDVKDGEPFWLFVGRGTPPFWRLCTIFGNENFPEIRFVSEGRDRYRDRECDAYKYEDCPAQLIPKPERPK
jgi:hypothetical protein